MIDSEKALPLAWGPDNPVGESVDSWLGPIVLNQAHGKDFSP